MHWFFALTEDSTAFVQYAEMIMVAVHTARKFTSLVPHCIYDGGDNGFTEWLTKHDVRIIRHRSFLREPLAELGRRKGNPHLAAAMSYSSPKSSPSRRRTLANISLSLRKGYKTIT